MHARAAWPPRDRAKPSRCRWRSLRPAGRPLQRDVQPWGGPKQQSAWPDRAQAAAKARQVTEAFAQVQPWSDPQSSPSLPLVGLLSSAEHRGGQREGRRLRWRGRHLSDRREATRTDRHHQGLEGLPGVLGRERRPQGRPRPCLPLACGFGQRARLSAVVGIPRILRPPDFRCGGV